MVAWSAQPGCAAAFRYGEADATSDAAASLDSWKKELQMATPSATSIATPTIPQPAPLILHIPSRRRTYYYTPSVDDDREPTYNDDPVYALPSYYDRSTNDDDEMNWSDNFSDGSSIRGPALIVVIVMFVVSMIVIICGWNLASDDLNLNESPDVLVTNFHEQLFQDKNWTFTIPKFAIPSPCGARPLYEKTRATRHALFFTTRIKCKWKPFCAWVQFFMGWFSFFTSIVALVAPSNTVNSVLGCGAMFTSEVLVHVWYGYFRYPNVATWCKLQELDSDFFEEIKQYSTTLYHGDREHREDKRIEYIGFLPTLTFHISAFVFILVMLIALSYGQGNNNNNRGNNNSVRELLPCVVWIGALLGSLVYPLCFLFITHPVVKILAPILHHIAQEYYEAKLFEKDFNHLCLSICFKFFGEALLPIFDEPTETTSGIKGGFENVVDQLDMKNEEEYKQNDVTRNETESHVDENDEEIPAAQEHPTARSVQAGEEDMEEEIKVSAQELELDEASNAVKKDVMRDDSKGTSLDP